MSMEEARRDLGGRAAREEEHEWIIAWRGLMAMLLLSGVFVLACEVWKAVA